MEDVVILVREFVVECAWLIETLLSSSQQKEDADVRRGERKTGHER